MLRLLSRLLALHSSLAQPARAMLSIWAPLHGTPSQTVCNPGNETQAHLSQTRPRVAAQVMVGSCAARIMAKRKQASLFRFVQEGTSQLVGTSLSGGI